MLQAGVPADCFHERDQTALVMAALNNRAIVANVLLESGANVNWQDRFGFTPLMKAALYNNTHVMAVLLHHGADRSIVDVDGTTALDYARLSNNKEAIQLLEKY